MDIREIIGRQREAVVDALNRLIVAQKALRIQPGVGIRLTRTASGVSINASAMLQGFIGAWNVTLSGGFASVGLGYVDGIEPYLDGKPLSGEGKDGNIESPRLSLDKNRFEDGRSYIALRVECDAQTGKILEPKDAAPGITIVQVASLVSEDDTIAFHAIAMLRRPLKDKEGFGRVRQIAFFDYQHRVARQNGRLRHFFDPA